MARRLNIRLLAHVLIFLGVPAGLLVLALAMGWFSGGDPTELFKAAKKAYENEEYTEAWIAIRKAAKAGGANDPEVMCLMGDIALKQTPPAVSQAIGAYRAALSLKPDYLEAQRKLAELYVAVRFWKEALAEIKRLHELEPSFGPAYLWEARAQMGLADAEPIRSKKRPYLEAAAAACEAGVAQAPHLMELYRLLVHLYTRLEQTDKIQGVVDRALANNPKDPDAYLLKSGHLMSQEKTDEAVAVLKKGLEVVGPHADLYVALGEVAVRQNDLEAAKTYFAQAIEADPTSPRGYLRLSGVHRLEGQNDKAVQVLVQGLEKIPDSGTLLAQLADLYLDLSRYKEADETIARLEKVAAASHKVPGAVEFLKGKRALVARHIRQAITFLEEAAKKQPGPQARLLLGRAYMLAGELGAAEETLQDLVDQDPALTPAWRSLAEVQLRLRRYDRAARSARVVLQRQPRDTDTRLVLARALALGGNVQEALAEAQKAAAGAPNDPKPLLMVAEIQSGLGRNDLAEATYRKALSVAKDDPKVYQAFLQFYRRTGQDAKLKALLQEAQENLPEGSFFAVTGTADEIEAQLKARVASPDATARDFAALADLYRRTNRMEEAGKVYAQVLEKAEPKSTLWRRAWQNLFLLRLQKDEYEAAVKMVEQLKGIDPERQVSPAFPGLLPAGPGAGAPEQVGGGGRGARQGAGGPAEPRPGPFAPGLDLSASGQLRRHVERGRGGPAVQPASGARPPDEGPGPCGPW